DAVTFQIGAGKDEKMELDIGAALTTMHQDIFKAAGGFNGGTTSPGGTAFTAGGTSGKELTQITTGSGATLTVVSTGTENANATIDNLKTAIESVSKVRSSLGAAANRLDHVYNNLSNVSSNTAAATGRIMDVDFATESSNMTSKQMLLQAGTAMLKQTNSMSSMVMSLLQ
ncbi:flagellin, partial [Massilia norwichensis]|uniref:flagellin n=1 Tax=Massilia norwichensis TaxID=1442366 RepID=UPI00362DE99D